MESIEFAISLIIGFILIILGILIFNGKCLILIAGYNTLSNEEKEKIDKKYLSKKTGLFLSEVGILCIILGMAIKYFTKYMTYISIIFVLIIITQTIFLIYSVNKKR